MIIEEELLLPWIFTIVIIIFKFGIATLLFNLVSKQRKEDKEFRLTFLFAMFVFVITLAISRIFYFIFDFYLTKTIPDLFYIYPNIWFWKSGNLSTTLGGVVVLYTLDKLVYQMKLKKIPEITLIIVALVQFLYPVNDKQSFDFVSTIGIIGTVISIIIPITFLSLGYRSAGQLKQTSYILGFGIVIYGLIGQLLSEPILASLEAAYTPARVIIVVLVPLLKMITLSLLAFAATRFRV